MNVKFGAISRKFRGEHEKIKNITYCTMGTHVPFISEGLWPIFEGLKPFIFRGFGVQRYKAMLVFREAQKIFVKPCRYVFLACIYFPTENKPNLPWKNP